jgi:hypothetical protein
MLGLKAYRDNVGQWQVIYTFHAPKQLRLC